MASIIKIPHLDKLTIQNYVGLSSFHKGEKYVLNQAIRQGKLKNRLLTAVCQGQEFDPYRVEVIFNGDGIQQSHCSCPVGAAGKCKHVAALLMAWIDNPEIFTEWEAIKHNLESYDSSTLLELIDLLDDNSEHSFEIIHAFNQHLQTVKSPRLAKYARRIDKAFHISEFPWYHLDEGGLTEIAFSLEKIRSDADQLLKEGQVEEAIRIDQNLIQQILNHLDDHLDPWSSLSEELKRCVQILSDALQRLDKREDLRLKIFQILFGLIEEQLYRQSTIAAEEAKQVILQHVRPIERDKIVSWIKALQKHQMKESKFLVLEDFLIDLQKNLLEPDIYLNHYRETGQGLKLVDSLLALGRVKEAKHIAQQKEFIFQTLSLADLFIKYQQETIAENLVIHFSKDHLDLQTLRWLKNFYEESGHLDIALDKAKHILYLSPSLNYYQTIQNLAQKINRWPTLRSEIINHFKCSKNPLFLVEIYLDEKLIENAIQAFDKISHLSHYSFKDTYYALLALRLAAEVRAKYPSFALKIYQNSVDSLIEERSRESYRRACDHLKTIQTIFDDLHQRDEWQAYLRSLLQTYRRLNALKDEIYRANLINT